MISGDYCASNKPIKLMTSDEAQVIVDFDLLATLSAVVAEMRTLPQGSNAVPEPIDLPFATAAGLRLLLDVLVGGPVALASNLGSSRLASKLPEAIRIAMVLEIDSFGSRLLEYIPTSPACGLRYAISQVFAVDCKLLQNTAGTKAHSKSYYTPDNLLLIHNVEDVATSEILGAHGTDEALDRRDRFPRRRKAATEDLKRSCTHAVIGNPQSVESLNIDIHARGCRVIRDRAALRRMLTKTAAPALKAMRVSHSSGGRMNAVTPILKDAAGICRGCQTLLRSVYQVALEGFDEDCPKAI